MNDKVKDDRFHIAVRLTKEQRWKLKEVAARRELTLTELIRLRLLEIIETEDNK